MDNIVHVVNEIVEPSEALGPSRAVERGHLKGGESLKNQMKRILWIIILAPKMNKT